MSRTRTRRGNLDGHSQILSANRLLFDLASRLGSLEGFLYA